MTETFNTQDDAEVGRLNKARSQRGGTENGRDADTVAPGQKRESQKETKETKKEERKTNGMKLWPTKAMQRRCLLGKKDARPAEAGTPYCSRRLSSGTRGARWRAEGVFTMKPLENEMTSRAKIMFAFALCTLLASAAVVQADDNDTQSKGSSKSVSASASTDSKGSPGTDSNSSTGTSSSLSRSEQKFIRDAAKGGMMEVEMGKLGVKKAQNEQLKQYAQRLIDDHTKANAELKQLAASKGITLPDDKIAGTTDDTDRSKVREQTDATTHEGRAEHGEHAATLKRLEQLSGTEFDREFVRMAVTDHEKDVKEFEKQAQKAADSDVKSFAQKTAPTLREHLQQARSLESGLR